MLPKNTCKNGYLRIQIFNLVWIFLRLTLRQLNYSRYSVTFKDFSMKNPTNTRKSLSIVVGMKLQVKSKSWLWLLDDLTWFFLKKMNFSAQVWLKRLEKFWLLKGKSFLKTIYSWLCVNYAGFMVNLAIQSQVW